MPTVILHHIIKLKNCRNWKFFSFLVSSSSFSLWQWNLSFRDNLASVSSNSLSKYYDMRMRIIIMMNMKTVVVMIMMIITVIMIMKIVFMKTCHSIKYLCVFICLESLINCSLGEELIKFNPRCGIYQNHCDKRQIKWENFWKHSI